MAKKKAAKKAAPKPKPKKAAKTIAFDSRRGADRAAAAKKTTAAAKQRPLIKGLRISALDRHCSRIADTRAAIARLQAEEKDIERHAHVDMRKHKQVTWQSAGVTLIRVPGEEKLRVTTSRNGDSTAPAPPVEEDELEEGATVEEVQEAADELGAAIEDADEPSDDPSEVD